QVRFRSHGDHPRGDALREDLRLRDANRNFDRFVGAGRDTIDRALVRADVEDLERPREVVKRYVDETIAHMARDPKPSVPIYGELNAAVDRVAELAQEYASLLNAEILLGFEPTIQEDWKAPLDAGGAHDDELSIAASRSHSRTWRRLPARRLTGLPRTL